MATLARASALASKTRRHRSRLKALRKRRDSRSDAGLCDEYRAILRLYRNVAQSADGSNKAAAIPRQLRALAKEALLHLGADADVRRESLTDYNHKRYGPYLGVSDEGSAAEVIRAAAFASPKVLATRTRSPMVVGVAHDAERLGAVGEVPVGPAEYSRIWLESAGRMLTSTNVGTRLNLRFYKRNPVCTVPAGSAVMAVSSAKAELKKLFEPFFRTPDGIPRRLTVFVQFDRTSRRSFEERRSIMRELAKYVLSGAIADPDNHELGFLMRIGFGAKGRAAALLGVNLARAAGLTTLAIDGVVRKAADEMVSLPGLLNYLEPEDLAAVLQRAAQSGIQVRPKNTVDPDTVARNVWASLLTARHMGLDLGKYGTLPLTLEECDEVVKQYSSGSPAGAQRQCSS